jgi:hypothetical protein
MSLYVGVNQLFYISTVIIITVSYAIDRIKYYPVTVNPRNHYEKRNSLSTGELENSGFKRMQLDRLVWEWSREC